MDATHTDFWFWEHSGQAGYGYATFRSDQIPDIFAPHGNIADICEAPYPEHQLFVRAGWWDRRI